MAVCGRVEIEREAAAPILWAWEPIVVAGTLNLVGGESTSGKTTLLFLLALSLAQDEPTTFLGHLVRPAPKGQCVVIVEAEQGKGAASRKLKRCQLALRAPPEALDRIILVAKELLVVGSPDWKHLETLCQAGLVSDVILDTLASTTTADANDEKAQVEIFRTLVKLVRSSPSDTPTTLWIAAHTRKSETLTLADVAGAHQRIAQVDTGILIETVKDKDTDAIKYSTVRFAKLKEEIDGPHPAPVRYRVSVKNGVQVLAKPVDQAGRPVKVDEGSLLNHLASRPKEQHTASSILRALGGGYAEVKAQLAELVEAKKIGTRVEVVAGNSCAVFFALPRSKIDG
jgi:hypothetical protein